jgi:sugar lactone lactonase YvrE
MSRLALLPVFAVLAVATGAIAALPAHAESSNTVSVFAGTGAAGSSGDGGPATGARLNAPNGIAAASDRTVYISDTGNHTVRAVAPGGTIHTVAGTGKVPPTSAVRDGLPGTQFNLASPADLAIGPDRSLYIADIGLFRVFRLTPDGHITVLAGTGVRGYTGDGGPATAAQIGQPVGLTVDDNGTVYFGDPDNQRVRAVGPDGTITTAAGNGRSRLDAAGGAATGLALPAASSLARDSAGDLWVVDSGYLHQLRAGRVVTVTEPGTPAGQRWGTSSAASWPPPDAPLSNVQMVAADGGTIYVLTAGGLLRLGAAQRLETVAGVSNHTYRPMAAAGGAVYLVDGTGNQVYVVYPAALAAPPSGTSSSTPWWPFALVGAAALALITMVLGVRRGLRSAH